MSRPTRKDSAHAERVPVSEGRNVLTVKNPDPNFKYRFVNDDEDRVEMFKRGGWIPVGKNEEDTEDAVANTADSTSSVKEKYVGGGKKAILMKLPKDLYDEDQARKQARIDELEASMNYQETGIRDGQYGKVKIN